MRELRLPPSAVISLIVGDGHTLVPDRQTTLRHGDQLLLIVPSKSRLVVERRLRAVHRAGRLAGWLGENGEDGASSRNPDDGPPGRSRPEVVLQLLRRMRQDRPPPTSS